MLVIIRISLQGKKKKHIVFQKRTTYETQTFTFSIHGQSVFKIGIILIKEQVYKCLWAIPLGM